MSQLKAMYVPARIFLGRLRCSDLPGSASVDPILSTSPSWLPFPSLSSSGSHLRCPRGSPQLREAPPVAVRRSGLTSHSRAPPSFCKVNKDQNYLSGRDRIPRQIGIEEFHQIGVKEFRLVDGVSDISDVGLQLLVEGEGDVELVQRLLVLFFLLL